VGARGPGLHLEGRRHPQLARPWGDRGDHVQDGDDLATLAERLYVVLVTNILLDLGIDAAAAA
jgi:hypothetical protein